MNNNEAAVLIAELRKLGVNTQIAKGSVQLVAPKGRITPEIIERVRAHKDGVKAISNARWTADDAYEGWVGTIARVKEICNSGSRNTRLRALRLLESFEQSVDELFGHSDYEAVRFALAELEKEIGAFSA